MTPYKVLIVEDELITADHLAMTLEQLGYDVTAIVMTGEEAIEKASESKPDVVIMDIKLDGQIDGIEAAEQINSRFQIPIIYLTAYAEEDLLDRAKLTQPMGYLLKPFGIGPLRCQIEVAIYKSRMEKRLRESEERLQLALQGADLGFWDWNIETGATFYSARWTQMLGYTSDDIQPHISFWEGLIHPNEAVKAREAWNQHLRGLTDVYESEHRLRTKSGDYRCIRARGKVVERDGQDKPIRMAGAVMDVTSQNRIAAHLEKALDKLIGRPGSDD